MDRKTEMENRMTNVLERQMKERAEEADEDERMMKDTQEKDAFNAMYMEA